MMTVDNIHHAIINAIHAANANTPAAQARIATYYQFLAAKADITVQVGLDVTPDDLNPWLLPHQRVAVAWAARRGRGLIGSKFGMGKTGQQCELLRLVHERTGQPVLQIVPLGARHQFMLEDGNERTGLRRTGPLTMNDDARLPQQPEDPDALPFDEPPTSEDMWHVD